ncbi:MAG TPA: 50S ribosomal protein L11 methyltransferase [Mycobacteriales bacterium]
MRYASWLALVPAPTVPELLLHQADDMHGLWQEVGTEAPPFWAFAWLGGQALARHVLDHPSLVRGRRVLDLATGSGIVALAAARAGAAHVLAVDVDPLAGEAVLANADANGLTVEWACADVLGGPAPEVDVVLAADVLYDREMAPRVLAWLRRSATDVLISDPGRDYCPAHELTEVASYVLPADLELEGMRERRTRIFTL